MEKILFKFTTLQIPEFRAFLIARIHAARLEGFKYGKIYYLEIVVDKKETSSEPWGS